MKRSLESPSRLDRRPTFWKLHNSPKHHHFKQFDIMIMIMMSKKYNALQHSLFYSIQVITEWPFLTAARCSACVQHRLDRDIKAVCFLPTTCWFCATPGSPLSPQEHLPPPPARPAAPDPTQPSQVLLCGVFAL